MRGVSLPDRLADTAEDSSGPHTLLVANTDDQRRLGVVKWVGHELAIGAKVVYAGWLDGASSVEHHWLVGPRGPCGARDALSSGQLTFVDMLKLVEHTGRLATPLLELQLIEIRRALDQGWPRIAMTADSPHRPMGEGEADELIAHERGITSRTGEWPLSVLCQLAVSEENDAAVWETVAAHHRDVVDGQWSAREVDGVWMPRGELDAPVARRFGAALNAALGATATSSDRHDRDVHVDLSEVDFMDVACAELLTLAARSAVDQRVVLRRPTRIVRRLIDALGRPRSVVFADGEELR